MKKIIVLVCALSGAVLAQTKVESYFLKAWEGTFGSTTATQYVGEARTTEYTDVAPSPSASVWKITKKTYDAAGLPLSSSVARSATGDNFGAVWTNRINASYNAKP